MRAAIAAIVWLHILTGQWMGAVAFLLVVLAGRAIAGGAERLLEDRRVRLSLRV